MAPLVSILIPAYNAERWIEETLGSAVGQTYPNVEVILVNDGSRDRTLEIARRFESKRLKIIDQANAGAPAARNRALEAAQGDYIQWLDHDDVLAPDKIASQLKQAEFPRDDRVLLSGPFGVFFQSVSRARFEPGPLWRDLTPTEYFHEKFKGNTYLQTSSWLVSRKLTDLAGPWWSLRSPDDDGEYFCRIVTGAKRIQFVPEAKCYWRIGNFHSFSEARSLEALNAFFESTCRSIRHFRSLDDSPSARTACLKFLQDRMILFYPEAPEIVDKMRRVAAELGGELSEPTLRMRYRVVRRLFGWAAAKKASNVVPKVKVIALRNWERFGAAFSAK